MSFGCLAVHISVNCPKFRLCSLTELRSLTSYSTLPSHYSLLQPLARTERQPRWCSLPRLGKRTFSNRPTLCMSYEDFTKKWPTGKVKKIPQRLSVDGQKTEAIIFDFETHGRESPRKLCSGVKVSFLRQDICVAYLTRPSNQPSHFNIHRRHSSRRRRIRILFNSTKSMANGLRPRRQLSDPTINDTRAQEQHPHDPQLSQCTRAH